MDFSDSEQKVPGSGSEKKLISSFLSLPLFLGFKSYQTHLLPEPEVSTDQNLSNKLTWANGKWTRNDDVYIYFLLKMGGFYSSDRHVIVYQRVPWCLVYQGLGGLPHDSPGKSQVVGLHRRHAVPRADMRKHHGLLVIWVFGNWTDNSSSIWPPRRTSGVYCWFALMYLTMWRHGSVQITTNLVNWHFL